MMFLDCPAYLNQDGARELQHGDPADGRRGRRAGCAAR
jgi:hypothetical protein